MKFTGTEEKQLEFWLRSELEALDQRNPGALSKLIVSLVKQDKSENALKKHCISELTTFLKTTTEDFVEVMFQAIEGIIPIEKLLSLIYIFLCIILFP